MGNVIGARIPGWFSLLSILGLLWNAFGVVIYLKSVGLWGDPLTGLDPAHQALARSIPSWVTGAFAVAVFAGLIGSFFMVARRRTARPLLILSLLAVFVQSVWLALISNARAVEGATALAMPALITLVAILLAWAAARGTKRCWLD
jgi:hypothetical protein